jgi:DNA-binding transcriptional LysR family regulator
VLPLTTRDPRRLVEEADADLAVGYFPNAIAAIVAQGADATLHHRQLYATEYVCVMRRDHPLADQELTLDAFVEAHHLLVTFSGRAARLRRRGARHAGPPAPHRADRQPVRHRRQRRRPLRPADRAAAAVPAGHRRRAPARAEAAAAVAGAVNVEMMWHLRKDDDPAHRWLRERLIEAAARKPGSRR